MRHYTHLTQEQRYQIFALLKEKVCLTRIAQNIGVHKSTISRELRRNQGVYAYFPAQAHRMALDQRRDKSWPRIPWQTWALVEDRMRCEQWSPEQISGYLARKRGLRLSHESIYRYVRADKQEGGDLYRHLRCRKRHRKRYASPPRTGPIVGRTSIDERPAVVDRRERIGDWEADTIVGKPGKAVIVSLVERRSRLTRLAKASCRKAGEVEKALTHALEPLVDRVHTVTCDNGSEFARHASLSTSLKALFFFAHPYASWERGLNENTNGLVRQYFPKGTDLTNITDEEIQTVMDKLNTRPRKTLGYRTPNEAFFDKRPTVALRG